MLKNIHLPRALQGDQSTIVSGIPVQAGSRIRSGQVLLELLSDDQPTQLKAESNGWLRFVAIRPNQELNAGDLLFIVDTIDTTEYRSDAGEINPDSELGKDGRRGAEREGQRAFGSEFSGELFDAPSKSEGAGQQSSVKSHPLLERMKEGVPQKMSNAENNAVATDRLAEDASNDPELRKQLSAQLESRLQIGSAPSAAPTLGRG
jgi:pyruvate/2-oxoglutarate dehydrogenase complex dihydrolipoamide acyltransferase (E2) component